MGMSSRIPFNVPHVVGKEFEYLAECCASGRLAGDGPFTHKVHHWLEAHTGAARAWLVHSGTAALEMAALLIDIQPGDEVIMPSFTFVSTANAFLSIFGPIH
jgi:dTDP-4-amino-4,6-dideoxygalactose transaminase